MFGYKIKFNYNQTDYNHKTIIGGILSIILKVLFICYVGFLLDQMVFFRDDRNYTSYILEKPQNLKADYFKNGVIMYHSIY